VLGSLHGRVQRRSEAGTRGRLLPGGGTAGDGLLGGSGRQLRWTEAGGLRPAACSRSAGRGWDC
jgi:hypothetical protein